LSTLDPIILFFLFGLAAGLLRSELRPNVAAHEVFLGKGIVLLISSAVGIALGLALGLSLGGTAMLGILAASASYIAVPAVKDGVGHATPPGPKAATFASRSYAMRRLPIPSPITSPGTLLRALRHDSLHV